MGLKLEIEGTKYYISWIHDRVWPAEVTGDNGGTWCGIFDRPDSDPEKPVWEGFAYCSLKDKFSKETGRKVSLTKALALWPREKRKLVWEAYFKRKA